MTAHHSCVITNVIGEILPSGTDYVTRPKTGEHIIVTNMRDLEVTLNDPETEHKHQEIYNDCVQLKSQAMQAFNLGIFTLDELAKTETMYWRILNTLEEQLQQHEFVARRLK
eukprot:TRINITY_DN25591_c0_g1_i1.p1 TRINITY_DN25591_c0_g1~~TRINITY_DN25591_c0_g1_i1.p1  ORF type:complete len:130 (+),score=15.07 TRINITY_DN25591_c0_g1_i1:57-392(+)